MTAYLELRIGAFPELTPLEKSRVTVGRATGNDIVVEHPTVSKLHAVLECYSGEWCIRDVGSANGTFVNGRSVSTETRLSPGDGIALGGCTVVFRAEESNPADPTDRATGPPELTRREKAVLIALCRPLLSNDASFAQPSSIREMAAELVVSEAAVKFHLANLYDKFALYDTGGHRRVQLANEALRRRAIALSDLAPAEPKD